MADAVFEFFPDNFLFGLAQLLHDRLFGGLRGDAAEVARRHFPVDDVADFGFGKAFLSPRQNQLVVVGQPVDHFKLGPGADVAGFGIDLDREVAGRMNAFLGCGKNGGFERADQLFAIDAAFLLDIFQNGQKFAVHTPDSPVLQTVDGLPAEQ
ncbi:hypothetical protein SDC9_80733 [bioreactor metagenome]|uniref:Uncharacterized protein n=1 Tax=bioreactor metagenome TaxID=1076179 RepID=A0A644Z2A2_9ZZZZ